MDQTTNTKVEAILTEMATLTTMERGTLSEEHRTRRASGGRDSVRLGPYYKLQAWDHGRNASRRVSAAEVPALKEDLANYERFTTLADAFVEETIARTRRLRRASLSGEERTAAKKNSMRKAAAKGMRKRKPSSSKPKRG